MSTQETPPEEKDRRESSRMTALERVDDQARDRRTVVRRGFLRRTAATVAGAVGVAGALSGTAAADSLKLGPVCIGCSCVEVVCCPTEETCSTSTGAGCCGGDGCCNGTQCAHYSNCEEVCAF